MAISISFVPDPSRRRSSPAPERAFEGIRVL
jgi:hypothetical protein